MKFTYAIVVSRQLHRFNNNDKDALFQEVSEFLRKININFTNESLMKQIERQSLSRPKNAKIGLSEAVTGALATVRSIAGISVSDAEIIRRSEICNACPLVDRIGGCGSCGLAGKISSWANKIRSTKGSQIAIPSEVKSSYCGFCSCALAVMVLTKYQDFHYESPEKNATRPDGCWLKTTSTKFTNE